MAKAPTAGVKNGLQTTTDSQAEKMTITLVKDERSIASTVIDIREASNVAAVVLRAAQFAQATSGKPLTPPNQRSVTTLPRPSALNVAQSRTPECTDLIFHFGNTSLGISIPNSVIAKLGQKLMTLAANGTAQ